MWKVLATMLVTTAYSLSQQQAPPWITQKTAGWCSPAIANVIGNVNVTCIGVDPRALKRLNAELRQQHLQLAEKMREADEWTARYKELEARLAEANDDTFLYREAERYLHEGELEQAGAILDQLISKDEKQIDRIASDHYNRGLIFQLQLLPLKALPHFQKAHQYRPNIVQYGLVLANLLLDQNDYQHAEPVFNDVLANAQKLAKKDPDRYLPDMAQLLNARAILYRHSQRLNASENDYKKALRIRRELAKKDSRYEAVVAETLSNLGLVYSDNHDLARAKAAYDEALTIRQKLAERDPDTYELGLTDTLNNLGNLYSDLRRREEAEPMLLTALQGLRKLADRNPAYLPSVANALNNLGSFYHDVGDAQAARNAFLESLGIRENLAKENSPAYQPQLAETLNNLGTVYKDMNQKSEADTSYEKALEIYRDLAEAQPAVYRKDVAMALNNIGALDTVIHPEIALMMFLEALEIDRDVASLNAATPSSDLAMVLNNLGTLYCDMRWDEKAEPTLEEAVGIYGELAALNPEPYISYLTRSENSLAVVYLHRGRAPEAQRIAQNAIELSRKRWQMNPAIGGDDFAESLVTASWAQTDASIKCELVGEAMQAVRSADLRMRIYFEQLFCVPPGG